MIPPVPHIASLAPYALASLATPEGLSPVSLSQNESLRPPSPRAIEAAAEVMHETQLYPDPDWTGLRHALAGVHGLAPERLLCGSGSMELIQSLCLAYAGPAASVLAPAHAYPFFRTATQLAAARYDVAPENHDAVCVQALLDAVKPDTRIVFLANPGNPTGTRIPRSALLYLREHLRHDILLVIDEAYGEFADGLDAPCFDLVDRGNAIVLRSFSKSYGLAGMRVGWGVFPDAILKQLRKVMLPNNISRPAQAAARAALTDQSYMQDTCALTARLRDGFIARLRGAGFDLPDSFTNFVLLRFANADLAERADQVLREAGIIARAQASAGLHHCVRITVGPADQLDHAAGVLEKWTSEGSP